MARAWCFSAVILADPATWVILVGPMSLESFFLGSMGTLGGFSSMCDFLDNSWDISIDVAVGPAHG